MNGTTEMHLRTLGRFGNLTKAVESVGARIPHLAVGVFAGFPDGGFAARVSIAFLMSVVLEVPSGYLADRWGHKKSLFISFWIGALAIVLLIAAVLQIQNPRIAVALLVISSIVSALAGALSSGSYESFTQDAIDHWSKAVTPAKQDEFRENALSLSQNYGKAAATLIPMASLGITLSSYYYFGMVALALLLPLFGIVGMAWWLKTQFPEIPDSHTSFQRDQSVWQDLAGGLRSLANLELKLVLLGVLLILYPLLMIHVNTFYIVAEIRALNPSRESTSWILPALAIYFSLDISLFLRGWIVPRLAKRLSTARQMQASFAGLILICAGALALQTTSSRLLVVTLFCMLLRTAVSLGQNTAQSQFMMRVATHRRSTAFSILQTLTIVIYGVYSGLVAFDQALPSPSAIMIECLVLAGLGMAAATGLAQLNAGNERSSAFELSAAENNHQSN